ncbi:MAG TPA: hypothetical protein VFL90_07510 [Methylomirabilota bacterium]|nr:hypothetical protein [Methylomirabilota bacterium]
MKLFVWGVIAVALLYGAYCGMISAWSWIAVNNAVDAIISKEGVESTPSAELKAKVMTATNEAGVPLSERDVTITNDGRVTVEVVWTIPVVVFKGETVMAVPLTVRRTSGGAAGR